MSEGLGTDVVTQVGLIVRDIEKSVDAYVDVFGLKQRPGVSMTDTVDTAHTRYMGQPSEARAKLAFIDMGQVTIELIQPVGGPSTWKDFLDAHGEGVHHIAFMVKGTDQVLAYLAGKGMPLIQRGDYTGGQYSYVDTAPRLGVILELLEDF